MNQLLNAALEYAANGLPVFPLVPYRKNPITENGVKDATLDEATIKAWWTKWPNANIGIPMGPISGLIGLDLDYKDGCDKEILKRLPNTVIQNTPNKGHHAFFKWPENGIKNGKIVELGCTVRAEGYYFAVSPSHFIETEKDKKCNGYYSFYSSRGLGAGQIQDCPEWIIEHEGIKLNKKSAQEVREGSRHEKLKTLAVHLRFIGRNQQEILTELNKCNLLFPDGQKSEAEVLNIVSWTMDNIEPDISKEGTTPYDIAQSFLHDNGFLDGGGLCKLRYYREDFYRYKDNTYQKLDDEWIEDLLNRWLVNKGLKKLAGGYKIKPVFNMLKIKPIYLAGQIESPCWIDNGHTEKTPWLIPLKNGIFDLRHFAETKEIRLLPHSPNFFCAYLLPFEYSKNAICPIYNKFLNETFDSEEVKLSINEMLGVHIYMPFLIEKFFVLVGEGSNGKSVLRTILTALIGKNNVSTVGLECFNSNNFSFISSLGKLSNMIPDMKDVTNIDEGVLKQFVSREPMIFNRKNKSAIQAEPTAFLTVCTNQLPKFQDKTSGIWRRLMIFNFNKTITEDKQNPRLREPEYWESELSGIFNLALDGILRVIRAGKITETEDMKHSVEEHQFDMNNVAQFLEDCLQSKPYHREPTRLVYSCYSQYVKSNGGRPLASRGFFKQLKIESQKKGMEIEVPRKPERILNSVTKVVTEIELNSFGRSFLYDSAMSQADDSVSHSVDARSIL